MHLHKQKLTKYFRGHYIIMVGVTNFKELGVTFSCSVFAAFFWELPKNFPHVCTQFILLEEENSIQYFLYDPSQTFVSCHARQFM